MGYPLPSGVGCQRWAAQPPRQREARPVAKRKPCFTGQRSQACRVDRVCGRERLHGDRTIEQAALGELGGELRRVGSSIGGAAENLREIDGRDDRTPSDCLGYNVGAGLLTKMGEQG